MNDTHVRKYQAEYDAYCERRRGYNFTSLDYVTWLSWHLNVPIPELKLMMERGEVW